MTRFFLFFLCIAINCHAECFLKFKSEKKIIQIKRDEWHCSVSHFIHYQNGLDITYCLEDIQKECEIQKEKLSIEKCPSTKDEFYADYDKYQKILYELGRKGKVFVELNGKRIREIFEVKYEQICNISGISGGHVGIGLFVTKNIILDKQIEGYIW